MFNNSNATHPPAECNLDTWQSRIDGFLFIFIFFSAVIGNLVVFVCYCKYRPLRRITNVYILSLSASDLLVACLTVPFSFGMFLCKTTVQVETMSIQLLIFTICDMVPSILSIYALALVAVDRAIAIAKPFWHRKHVNNTRASVIVFAMWMYVFGLVSMVFVVPSEEFTLFIIIMAYAVPVLMMICSYLMMGLIAKKHAKELSSLERTKTRLREGSTRKTSDNSNSFCSSDSPYNSLKNPKRSSANTGTLLVTSYHDQREPMTRRNSWVRMSMRRFSAARIRTRSSSIVSSMKILKRELKAAVTLSLILSCFIISWTPFMALNIEYYRCPDCQISLNMVKYFKILHYSNSALNPLLFIVLNKRWRSAFRIVILRKNKSPSWCSSHSDVTQSSVLSGW